MEFIETESKSSKLTQIENYLLTISLGVLGSFLYIYFEQTEIYGESILLKCILIFLIFLNFGYVILKVLSFVLRENKQFINFRFTLDKSYGILLFFIFSFIVIIFIKIFVHPFISENLEKLLYTTMIAISLIIIWKIKIPAKITEYYIYLRSEEKPYAVSHFPLTLLDVTELEDNKVEISLRNNTIRDLSMEITVEIPPNVSLIKINGLEDEKNVSNKKFPFILKGDTINDIDIFLRGKKRGIGELMIHIRHEYYKDLILLKIRVLEVGPI